MLRTANNPMPIVRAKAAPKHTKSFLAMVICDFICDFIENLSFLRLPWRVRFFGAAGNMRSLPGNARRPGVRPCTVYRLPARFLYGTGVLCGDGVCVHRGLRHFFAAMMPSS